MVLLVTRPVEDTEGFYWTSKGSNDESVESEQNTSEDGVQLSETIHQTDVGSKRIVFFFGQPGICRSSIR